ncbi:pleckstrin homology domain-containing family B member 1-like [Sinocyclocheilus rhinocerous]|uniref:pleckstrin homology domain-containing family B member 1-like n=1 Tax=Sinocyclocheilus rhinocerous TaxID=307959 RepID=UPI0007BA6667|nr:PREDICTED: pleckstrin homology domain-containing family B member 1-like [Sinocyclocheilus rhinocerous]
MSGSGYTGQASRNSPRNTQTHLRDGEMQSGIICLGGRKKNRSQKYFQTPPLRCSRKANSNEKNFSQWNRIENSALRSSSSSIAISRAWKLTLMEAKRNPVFTYNPYDDTYQTVPIDSHNAVYIMPSTGSGGTQHVWVHRDSYDNFGEQIALGLLAGMAAGAAMRSLLWMPFWFC